MTVKELYEKAVELDYEDVEIFTYECGGWCKTCETVEDSVDIDETGCYIA